jgi:hypothetical protein
VGLLLTLPLSGLVIVTLADAAPAPAASAASATSTTNAARSSPCPGALPFGSCTANHAPVSL